MRNMLKINERIERNGSVGESDIYRKFSIEFDDLFNAKDEIKNKEEFEKLYVSDIEFEKQIHSFRNSNKSMAKFCVGYTGIGKTTSIRYCFGLGVSNEAYINYNTKELIFPTFLDGYQLADLSKSHLATRISAVCTTLEEKFPELREQLKTVEGKKELYKFIRNHTAFALEDVNPIETMDLNDNELIILKLNAAYEKNAYEFQANKLKFYIKKKYSEFERLIILLDDIESLPEVYQRETIARYLKFFECMQNTDFPKNGSYKINLLISVRPHTYRIFNNNRVLETFSITEPAILKKNSVNLEYIFANRFDNYTSRRDNIGNMETWDKCYNELMMMNRAFGGQYKEMIMNLCFMNIRDTLAAYSRVFANRFWIQKNKVKEDIFTISSPEYNFNNINVIRALACYEESVFWGDDEKIIPNIFYTTEDDDLSIYCLLVIKYFCKKRGSEVYGISAERLIDVKNEWQEIFGKEVSQKFLTVLGFLFEKKILRKSILDYDDIETLDTKESLREQSRLYISPRGHEMFNMFSRDSVLLEMLREAAWRDYENREYSKLSSSELMKEGNQSIIFKDLLEYIDYICETEDNVLSTVKLLRTREKYKKCFGKEPVVQVLLDGVKKSLDYSGIMHNSEINYAYKEVKNKIAGIMKKF